MDSVAFSNSIEIENRGVKTKKKKRKWREIEAIKEKFRLKRELCEMDLGLEMSLKNSR